MNNKKNNLEKRHRNGNPSQMSIKNKKRVRKQIQIELLSGTKEKGDYEIIQPDPCWVIGGSSDC